MASLSTSLVLAAHPAHSDEPEIAPRLAPSKAGRDGRFAIALGIAGIGQGAEAQVRAETTRFERFPPRGQPPGPLFQPFGDEAERDLMKGAISISALAAGPTLKALPGKPRLTFDAGLYLPLDGRATIASAEPFDSPTEVRDPIIYVDARFHWRWYAGLGLEFRFPVDDWVFVVRPSVDYVGQAITVRAIFDEEVPPLPPQLITQKAHDSLIHHGFGARLAIEAEMDAAGPLIPTLYAEVQSAYLYGDFRGSFDIPGDAWLTSYDYKFARVAATGSAGFRLKWRGF